MAPRVTSTSVTCRLTPTSSSSSPPSARMATSSRCVPCATPEPEPEPEPNFNHNPNPNPNPNPHRSPLTLTQVRVMRNTGTGYVNFTTIEAALAAREDFTSKPTNQVPRHTAPPLHHPCTTTYILLTTLHHCTPHLTAPLTTLRPSPHDSPPAPSPRCPPHHTTLHPPLLRCCPAARARARTS